MQSLSIILYKLRKLQVQFNHYQRNLPSAKIIKHKTKLEVKYKMKYKNLQSFKIKVEV